MGSCAKGWTGVNALFADPPLSTSQILHPRNITSNEKIPGYPRFRLGAQMTESATVDQTLGEYLVQLLLTSNLTRQEARQIAAGWTGDQLSAYLEGESFDGVDHGLEKGRYRPAFDAPIRIWQRLHRLRFAASPGRTDSVQAELPRDRLMLLQLLGSFVLLLDGTTPFRSMQLADEVWKSLDAETESTVILFDCQRTDSVVSQKQITPPSLFTRPS